MKSIYLLLCATLMMSCKSSFIKRKYMSGHFVSRSASVHSKEIDNFGQHNTNEFIETVAFEKPKSNKDTIFLTSGIRIPCSVETITKKRITYTIIENPYTKQIIRNRKVMSIHFNGTQREYFKQPNIDGNPVLQFGLVAQSKKPKIGISAFGYVVLLFSSIGAVAASLTFFPLLIIFLVLLILLTTMNHETIGFKAIRGFGAFFGYLTLISFSALILLLLIGLLLLI